jgi:uncharacterized Rossmann fold enzyme
MAITQDERVLSALLKDPRTPMGTVEGFYDGDRAVFLCLIDQDETTGKTDITPVAMLLREEDIPKVTRPQGEDEKAPKIIIAKG